MPICPWLRLPCQLQKRPLSPKPATLSGRLQNIRDTEIIPASKKLRCPDQLFAYSGCERKPNTIDGLHKKRKTHLTHRKTGNDQVHNYTLRPSTVKPSNSSEWPLASPPESDDPQTTTLPSALMAANAASLAQSCTTSKRLSRTERLSPPALGAPGNLNGK